MKFTEKEILISYVLHNLDRYENDVIDLRQQLRYRNVDVVDCFELSLAIERLNAFKTFANDTLALLHLSEDFNKKVYTDNKEQN